MFEFLKVNYNKFSKADKYIIGFIYDGNVFFAIVNNIDDYVKLDKASRNAGFSLRLNLTKAAKIQLLTLNPTYLCKAKHFYKVVKNSQYNKGEIFEKMVFAKFRKKWKKDNIPFYESGDMKYKGVQYQNKIRTCNTHKRKANKKTDQNGLNKPFFPT